MNTEHYKAFKALCEKLKDYSHVDDIQAKAIILDLGQATKLAFNKEISVLYRNHEGITDVRRLSAYSLDYTETCWHSKTWIIRAFCHNRGQQRDFAALDFIFPVEGEARPAGHDLATLEAAQAYICNQITDMIKQHGCGHDAIHCDCARDLEAYGTVEEMVSDLDMSKVPDASLDTQITDNVIDFLVAHEMIDESDEYSLQDIMAALYNNRTPNKPVDVAAVRRQALEDAARLSGNVSRHYRALKGDELSNTIKSNIAYDIAVAIRALSPAEPVEQWQDIATAPKDGTWVLGIKDIDGYSTRVHSTFFDGKNWIEMRSGSHHSWLPTHWMKYPAAPTSKGGE